MAARRDRDGAARIAAIFLLLCLPLAPSRLPAAESEDPVHLRLVAAETGHGGTPFLAGIEMKLAEGWHSYWRNPGDSGFAPRFDWSASKNVASVDLRWPAPLRFDAPGDSTFGYEHEVVWPLLVTAKEPAKPVTLVLKMSYGVCSNICVPGEAELTLAVPASVERRAVPDAALIRRYLARVPAEPAEPDALSARFDGTHLRVRYRATGEVPQLIVEGPAGVWFGRPEAARADGAILYAVPVEIEKGATLKGAEVILTLSGPATAIEAVRSIE